MTDFQNLSKIFSIFRNTHKRNIKVKETMYTDVLLMGRPTKHCATSRFRFMQDRRERLRPQRDTSTFRLKEPKWASQAHVDILF